ncbi:MAG TPA: haloacid dehalogenase type II [Acidobacteriaceae bacterium]|jgi:2-haloacid dehalogenase|nr:haloacid dehalogenase type II [Acidobacteriaceae bacterium]
MHVNRKQFMNMMGAATATAATSTAQLLAEAAVNHQRIRAVAFDGFVIFDPRSVTKRVEEAFPGRGAEFANLWRTRQFEYTWLRTVGRQYVDFWRVTEDALNYAAGSLHLPLSQAQREGLMGAYRELPVWPDVPEGLVELRRRGIRLAFLSNFTASMLDANIGAAKLKGFFEDHLTTDRAREYKPSPRAYQMGPDAFGLKKEEIVFAAFGAWDAAGAKWFGYPTVWVNRAQVAPEELGARPDVITENLSGLLEFVGGQK